MNNIVTWKSGLEVTQDHCNWCHSKAWVRFTIQLVVCTATMAVFCEIFSVKKWYDLENRVRVRSRSLEIAHVIDRIRVPIHIP